MSHHTDLRSAEPIVRKAALALGGALRTIAGDEAGAAADGETVRHILEQLVVATRRNDPQRIAIRLLAQIDVIGSVAAGAAVRMVLEQLQSDARAPRVVLPPPPPRTGSQPLGDDDKTPVTGNDVVNPIETAVRGSGAFPSEPTTNKPVRGPWKR